MKLKNKARQSQSVSPSKSNRNFKIEREAKANPFAGLMNSDKRSMIKKSKVKSTFGVILPPVTQYMDRKSNIAFSKKAPNENRS
jgi:hypothetical protein